MIETDRANFKPAPARKRFRQARARFEAPFRLCNLGTDKNCHRPSERVTHQPWLAQSVEHETLNLRVVGSSPTLGVTIISLSSQ